MYLTSITNQWDDYDDGCDILQQSGRFYWEAMSCHLCLLALLVSQLSISSFRSLSDISSCFPLYSADDYDDRNMTIISRFCSNWDRRGIFLGNIFASSLSSVGGLAPSCSLDAPGQRKPEGGQSQKEGNCKGNLHQRFHLRYISMGKTQQNAAPRDVKTPSKFDQPKQSNTNNQVGG